MKRGISLPPVRRTFGFATHARQTGAIAWTSFWTIAKSPAGLALPAVALLLVLLVPVFVKLKGVSLLPTTPLVLSKVIAPVADNPRLPWVLIPLLIITWAGELVWRERDAGLSEIADATPVREWDLVLGKFLGLALMLVGWMALLIASGVLVQMRMGYFAFELGLSLQILLGLQLVDYLLFGLLVLVVHAVVNQKQLGYLAALVAYGAILFPSFLGIEHHLLIYGSGPRWSYSVVSGFGSSLGPWLWFKLYWAGWAVLLAVAGSLFWPRGSERGWGTRFRLARRRFTRGTAGVAVVALALIVTLGGFLFNNTNVLNRPPPGGSSGRPSTSGATPNMREWRSRPSRAPARGGAAKHASGPAQHRPHGVAGETGHAHAGTGARCCCCGAGDGISRDRDATDCSVQHVSESAGDGFSPQGRRGQRE